MNLDEWGLPVVDSEFITECDDELGEAIDAVILANAKATGQQEAICEHYEMLREAIYADTWALVEEIDSRVRQREEHICAVVARWAFDQGRGFPWPVVDGAVEPKEDAVSASKRPRIVDAPMAITSAGDVVVNVTHLDGMTDVLDAVHQIVPRGCKVFVGVVVPQNDRARIVRELGDALAELACRIGGRLVRAK